MSSGASQSHGPPYRPSTQSIGGTPTPNVDDPISAVLILLFLLAGAFHLTWRVKQHAHHRSRLGFLLFIFSVVRTVALVLRIAWASHSTSLNVAIAANVFTAAGVVILFIVNLIFVRRVLDHYASFGKRKVFDWALRFLVFCIAASIIMLVVAVVYSFFTLNPATRLICRKIQLFGSTYLTLLAFIPIPATLLALLSPSERVKTDAVARRRFRAKAQLLLVTASLLTLGAGFRCGTLYDARPVGHPTWFHKKAAFYCFNFGIEIVTLYIFAAARFDPRLKTGRRSLEAGRSLEEVGEEAGDKETSAVDGGEEAGSEVSASRWHRNLNHDREMFGGRNWSE